MITMSLCPECYKEIPAHLAVGLHVWMIKECPEHGRFAALVERDPQWFFACRKINAPSFYDGLMVDVTGQCNIKCKYCYHDNSFGSRLVENIIDEIKYYSDKAPFALTGGEPTLHPDIIEIIDKSCEVGETWLLTNGIKLADEVFFDKILNTGLLHDGLLSIGLSFHKESLGKDLEFVELCRKKGVKIGTSFYVIDDLDQMAAAVQVLKDNKDVLCEIRIKAASNLWHERNAGKKIFVSDMLKVMMLMGGTTLDTSCNNKISYGNVIHDGLKVKCVSWYDVQNVDLEDINCAPWYKANDGTLNNLVTTGLINEGLCK
jgi:organic radical activating enzyme